MAHNESLRTVLEETLQNLRITLKANDANSRIFLDARFVDEAHTTSIQIDELESLVAKVSPPALHERDALEEIVKFLHDKKPVRDRRVAKEHPLINGRDGKLLLLTKRYEAKGTAPTTNNAGQSSKLFRLYDNIEKGTVVARLYPPQKGTDGLDIFGRSAKAQDGKPATIKLDATLSLQEADAESGYQPIVAEVSGYLSVDSNQLTIKTELKIPGDVDIGTGDIDFVGSVTIPGSVNQGFHVSAYGNISIGGDVLRTAVYSRDGSITVKGNIVGNAVNTVFASSNISSQMVDDISKRRRVQVEAKGSVSANILDSVVLEASGSIEAEKEIRTSFIRTKDSVRCPRGQVAGGSLYAVTGVEARSLGSRSGATTKIYVCSDIESSTEFATLEADLRKIAKAKELLLLYLGPFADLQKELSTLSESHQNKINDLRQKLGSLDVTEKELTAKKAVIEATEVKSSTFRVSVHDHMYVGVEIIAGEHVFAPDTELKGPVTIEYDAATGKFTRGKFIALPVIADTAHA